MDWPVHHHTPSAGRRLPSPRVPDRGPHLPVPAARSFRQILKEFVRRRRGRHGRADLAVVGSGILRRADPSLLTVTSASTFVSFPHSIDRTPPRDHALSFQATIPNRFHSSERCSGPPWPSRASLLPTTSLSQCHLRQAYLHPQPSTGPRRDVRHLASPTVSVFSCEAEIRSDWTPPPSSPSSTPTLRLQPSRCSLGDRSARNDDTSLRRTPSHHMPPRHTPPRHTPSHHTPPRRHDALREDWATFLYSPTASAASIVPARPGEDDGEARREKVEYGGVEHFKTFCVLDTMVDGCPVVATSQELRYIFEIGEQFFLNAHECDEISMDLVTGSDANGDPVTHLVLFAPLVIPSSGRSRFLLVSLIDVTQFIHDAASLPGFDDASARSIMDGDLRTPSQPEFPLDWAPATCQLSADDLLRGCMLPEDRSAALPAACGDDIWLHLADEEKRRATATRPEQAGRWAWRPSPLPPSSPGSHSSPSPSPSHAGSNVDEVLDGFMSSLRELYSDFFLLGKSPLNDSYYEICNVSPTLHAARDYIHGHLSRTEPARIVELGDRLAQHAPFHLAVKWGHRGLDKRMYCSPLYGQRSMTWLCFLVDAHVHVPSLG